MTISSRTPEGSPNHCPICGNQVCIEPSLPVGDAPCPACGSLLWFIERDEEVLFFDPELSGLLERVAERLGVDPDALRAGRFDDLGLDSLSVVELVMELEEELK